MLLDGCENEGKFNFFKNEKIFCQRQNILLVSSHITTRTHGQKDSTYLIISNWRNLHKLSQIIKTTLENQPSLLLIHLILIGFFRLKNDIQVDKKKCLFYESRILLLNFDSNLAYFVIFLYWAFLFQSVIKLKAKLERRWNEKFNLLK